MTAGRRVLSARSLVDESALPQHEARRLLEAATSRSRAQLVRNEVVAAEDAASFERLAARRRAGEPLQYIEGNAQFGPVEVAVDPRVLIPRPETEELWELVCHRLTERPPRVIVDIGTGSASLAIALKHSFPDAIVHATDISAEALEIAGTNVAASGLDIELHRGDIFSSLPGDLRGRVDLVISNPPYIPIGEREALPGEVRDYEPAIALFAGSDGLSALRRIIEAAPQWLSPNGTLACEIGSGQGESVLALAVGLRGEIVPDVSGRDRFLIAQKAST